MGKPSRPSLHLCLDPILYTLTPWNVPVMKPCKTSRPKPFPHLLKWMLTCLLLIGLISIPKARISGSPSTKIIFPLDSNKVKKKIIKYVPKKSRKKLPAKGKSKKKAEGENAQDMANVVLDNSRLN